MDRNNNIDEEAQVYWSTFVGKLSGKNIWKFPTKNEIIITILLCFTLQVDCRCSGNIQKTDRTVDRGTQMNFPETTDYRDHEWSFKAAQLGDFLILEFDVFELGGPECDNNNTRFETVYVEINMSGQVTPYRFCKDRGPYFELSSMDTLKVRYCNRYMSGNIRFTVKSGCSSKYIVTNKTEKLKLNRSSENCSITLQSLTESGIDVKIKSLTMKKTKTRKCRSSYLVVKGYESTDKSEGNTIQLQGSNRYCFVLNEIHSEDLQFISKYPMVKIKYKRAEFTLLFSHANADTDPEAKNNVPPFQVYSTTKYDLAWNMTSTPLESDRITDTEANSLIHIIALSLGGVLVIIVVIGTMCIIKRRVIPTQSASSKSKVTKTSRAESANLNGIYDDHQSFDDSSARSLSNAMYDQVLEGSNIGLSNLQIQSQEMIKSTESKNNTERRLAELEEKYGPFPKQMTKNQNESGVYYSESMESDKKFSTFTKPSQAEVNMRVKHQNNYEATRRYTRPLLPVPTNDSQEGASENLLVVDNLYETIDCQDNELQAMTNLPSYDEVPDEIEDASGSQASKSSHRIRSVQYITKDTSELFVTPDIQVSTVLSSQKQLQDSPRKIASYAEVKKRQLYTTPSEPLLNTDNGEKGMSSIAQNPIQAHRNRHMTQSKSQTAINLKSAPIKHYLDPRPSLPELMNSKKYISFDSDSDSRSIGSLLQEDDENYLKPRPSCPDALIPCAYSSSEEISEMRIRLLKAAHPSLIKSAQSDVIKNKSLHDSPQSSLEGQSSNLLSNASHYYSAPSAN